MIIGRKGSLGTCFYIQTDYWPHDTTLWVRNFKGNDPAYCAALLQSLNLARFDVGSSNPTLNRNHLHKLPVAVPDLSVQRRIAGILSAYDDLIAVNERRIAVLEEMARRVFERWFVSPTLNDGSRWQRTTLQDWITEVREKADPQTLDPSVPYLGLEHFPRRSTTVGEWGDVATTTSTKSRFKKGDILFGKIRPYFHKVVHAPFDGVASSDAIVLRPKTNAHRAAALALCSSDAFIDHATQSSNGTKMPRANWSVLKETELLTPPPKVLSEYNAAASPLIDLADTLAHQNGNLRTTRDLLLPRLVSGEIVVSEAPFPLDLRVTPSRAERDVVAA